MANGNPVLPPQFKANQGRFEKGKSQNPGGRPKAFMEVLAIGRKAAPEIMRQLVDMALHHPDASVRIQAAGMVFDRTFGKAKQQIDVAGEVKHSFVLRAPQLLSAAEWEAEFAARTIEGTAEPASELNGSVNDDTGSQTPDKG